MGKIVRKAILEVFLVLRDSWKTLFSKIEKGGCGSVTYDEGSSHAGD